jgi:hypothetical protein
MKKSSPKAKKTEITKAKKASRPLSKVTTAVAKSRGTEMDNKKQVHRLTKEMLSKRQKAKGIERKQGGPKIAELTQQKLKTLSKHIEIGPTQAE